MWSLRGFVCSTGACIVVSNWCNSTISADAGTNKKKALIVVGGTQSPSHLTATGRMHRQSGTFDRERYLHSLQRDVLTMQEHYASNLIDFNVVRNLEYLQKEYVLQCIDEAASNCDILDIYYTGYAQATTGHWCFSDGAVTMLEIMSIAKKRNTFLQLNIDANFSGNWCLALSDNNIYNDEVNVTIRAASNVNQVAWDSQHGGEWTQETYKYCSGAQSRGCYAAMEDGNSVAYEFLHFNYGTGQGVSKMIGKPQNEVNDLCTMEVEWDDSTMSAARKAMHPLFVEYQSARKSARPFIHNY